MHSGQVKKIINLSKLALAVVVLSGISLIISCKDTGSSGSSVGFKFPEQGQSFGLGDEVKIALDVPAGKSITSVVYTLDGKPVGSKNNGEPVAVPTAGLSLGYKLITAVIEADGKKDTLTINIELRSSVKPVQYTYKIVNTFPHDTSAYTQGLEYHGGKFLESTGENGHSTLRWVDVKSGKVLQRIKLEDQYFGEGASLVDHKVVMLTYKANSGFVYDAKTFKQLNTFVYSTPREGWGLCFDGKQIMMSDGSNKLYFMNKETYQDESSIEVYNNMGPVDRLNELEYIDGKIYANLYTKNAIVVIDPKSGVIEQEIDFTGLLPAGFYKEEEAMANNVLNGIAWDKAGKRLFVTGKKWPKMFEVKISPKQ